MQIGCEYAMGGHRVNLVARDLDALTVRIEDGFRTLIDLLEGPAPAVDAARQNIWLTDLVADAATGCDIVVESLPEDLDLKAGLSREAASASPDALLASNTLVASDYRSRPRDRRALSHRRDPLREPSPADAAGRGHRR